MATTKIFPITSTEVKAISYIADFSKTDNGKLIYAHGCSKMPIQASKDFKECRAYGTGLNTVLSQHIIQSFAPGEITPEIAHAIGIELAKRLWGDRFEVLVTTHLNTKAVHDVFYKG